MRMAVVMGALALAGCAATAQPQSKVQERAGRELAKALEGRVAGEPRDCISAMGTSGPQIIDGRTMLYRQGSKVWRNDLPTSCPGLDDDDLLVIELWGSQICRNDHFRANSRTSMIPGPSCRFGKFTPYVKAR
ncbi:MAG: DUF6491 family protein [Pseudomonadota bacterium]